ncbi:MAG: S46 family peptidase [Flavobacterium sp.]
MKNKFILVLSFLNFLIYSQQGGMWIPSLLEGMNEKEMKSLGMKISAKEIYNTNKSSIKDAVPHFNGGCTSEVISSKGLLLTNHHCGFSQIQSHTTLQNNYLENGFWAMSLEEELPNPNLSVTFIVKIIDITDKVLTKNMIELGDLEKKIIIDENINQAKLKQTKEPHQELKVVPFYDGNQYLLFITETFKDVRLVGAPPSFIGKFGSDTDNWVWPRHTGDFTLFRIYANKDNLPAAYSKDNVPYKPKHFFPVSIAGIKENDFTMVMGYPGRTQEYLPAVAVEQIVNITNPVKIEMRDTALKIADGFMRKDPKIKIQYAAKYASIANYWKKWIGENKGLKKSNAIQLKKNQEEIFQKQIEKLDKTEYQNLFSEFESDYKSIEDYTLAREIFLELTRNNEFFNIGNRIYQLEKLNKDKNEKDQKEVISKTQKSLSNIFKDFNQDVDVKVFEKLLEIYKNKTPKKLQISSINIIETVENVYKKSLLINEKELNSLLSKNSLEIFNTLNQDAGYLFFKNIAEKFNNEIEPNFQKINNRISANQKKYMKAILELSPKNARIFPDANSTLRVTYGKVKGYAPADAVYYSPTTYAEGIIEKYIPGDYEFDVSDKMIELIKTKDYGRYAENGKLPVNFIATNHTTGGNSGSPALDKNGNLIGLNFDRVWEGTMSDIHYDPEICRNVMVDTRYILWVIEKYAGAKHLINEMKIITKN